MVRQLFFTSGDKAIRQVVFSATERETDVRSLCLRVGEALARESDANVAVAGKYPQLCQAPELQPGSSSQSLHNVSSRLSGNLWLVPPLGIGNAVGGSTIASLHTFLCELRREFEYSILAAPAADEWNQVASMGQLADGIVLVLSAERTRRVTARNMKDRIEGAHARVLGTVFCDREFPIPEKIYRRL
jgi:hypothetical protein